MVSVIRLVRTKCPRLILLLLVLLVMITSTISFLRMFNSGLAARVDNPFAGGRRVSRPLADPEVGRSNRVNRLQAGKPKVALENPVRGLPPVDTLDTTRAESVTRQAPATTPVARGENNIALTNASVEAMSTDDCPATKCHMGVCYENLVCHKPFEFLKNYKNPCFYEEVGEDDSGQSASKNLIILRMLGKKITPQVAAFQQQWDKHRLGKMRQLRCLPYFFIIGMEKCGTTDLYSRVNAHPDVILSPAKELQWWTRRRFFIQSNGTYPGSLQNDYYKMTHVESLVNVPLSHYYAFFDRVSEDLERSYIQTERGEYHYRITGDGSPNTVYWNDFAGIYAPVTKEGPSQIVAHHIAAVLPKAKIVCILRNPIDRLYSSYLFFNRGVSSHAFHDVVVKALELFSKCLAEFSLRYCVYDWKLKEDVGSTVNIMQGIYSVMISDWLKVFDHSQIYVMHFESYRQSELSELNRVFEFLEVPRLDAESPEGAMILNKSASLRGTQYKKVGAMLNETRTLLEGFYQPYNQQLATLLNDTRFEWPTSAAAK